jgi:hypothetical protein
MAVAPTLPPEAEATEPAHAAGPADDEHPHQNDDVVGVAGVIWKM